MDKKILVLGIGPAQVDLIVAAKQMGMTVFACAHNDLGPGLELVDEFKKIDIKDIEKVNSYAREKNVDIIYSMALETAVPTIIEVSEQLNLPSITTLDNLELLNSKTAWRQALGNIDGNVESQSLKSVQDLERWDSYPAMIKPVDSSGQRGVFKVNCLKDAVQLFDASMAHSTKKELIIEEYVDGPEISVNSIMNNRELNFAIISDRISYDEYPGGIIKEHHIPSRIVTKEVEQRIYNLVENVNQIMGFDNGHVYFQLKLKNGTPKIIEFTPRFDGCHMWRLIYESTGIDLRIVSLELLAYGKSNELLKVNDKKNLRKVKTKFISDYPGTVVNKQKYEIPEKTIYVQWYYQNQEKVKSITGYYEKLGYFIVQE